MILESGPARFDRLYYLGFFLVCVGLAGWFFYDGAWGYVAANRAEARRKLSPLVGAEKIPDTLGSTPTKPQYEAIVQTKPTEAKPFRDAFGEPFAVKSEMDGGRTEYYVSDYGMITLPLRGSNVDPLRNVTWSQWSHTRESLGVQYWCAVISLAVGLYVGFKLMGASSLRCRIDESMIVYGGRRIAFADVTGLRDYNRKGWVDLHYQENGQTQKLRIDNQKIAKFDEIIDVICERASIEDPRKLVSPDAHDEPANNADDRQDA